MAVQFSAVAQLCPILCDPVDCSMSGFPIHHQLQAYSNNCPLGQRCHPTISSSVVPFSSCLQFFPSIRVFLNESVLHIRWPKYWRFSFSISPSNEYSRPISFMMDCFDLLAVQGTLQESSPTPQFKNMVQKRPELSFLRSQLIWRVSTSG